MNTSDFRSMLLGLSGVAAIVGARVYPVIAPSEQSDKESHKPCIIYRTINAGKGRTFCGVTSLEESSIRVDAYGLDYDAAKSLGDLIVAGVEVFSGSVGSTRFPRIFVESENDLLDIEPGLFRRSIVLTVWSKGV